MSEDVTERGVSAAEPTRESLLSNYMELLGIKVPEGADPDPLNIGEKWLPAGHARFLAVGWKRLAERRTEQLRMAREESWDAGWVAARDTLRTYLTRALAECDPKTRKAIEEDLSAEGVEL